MIVWQNISNFQGKYVIYIGESREGCTANDIFFDILERKWEDIKLDCYIESFKHISDSICIYKRHTYDYIPEV